MCVCAFVFRACAVDFDWQYSSPFPAVVTFPTDYFSVIWTGQLKAVYRSATLAARSLCCQRFACRCLACSFQELLVPIHVPSLAPSAPSGLCLSVAASPSGLCLLNSTVSAIVFRSETYTIYAEVGANSGVRVYLDSEQRLSPICSALCFHSFLAVARSASCCLVPAWC